MAPLVGPEQDGGWVVILRPAETQALRDAWYAAHPDVVRSPRTGRTAPDPWRTLLAPLARCAASLVFLLVVLEVTR